MKGRESSEADARDLLTSFEKSGCARSVSLQDSSEERSALLRSNSHLYVTKNRKSFQHTATTTILPGEQCIDDCPVMQLFLGISRGLPHNSFVRPFLVSRAKIIREKS